MAESNPTDEEWRIVPDHPDYRVSNHGRFRSHKRSTPQILRPFTDKLGYVRLMMDGKHVMGHRIVASAWHGPCPDGKEVDHINMVRNDNRPENLRYLTRQENMARMVPHTVTVCVNGHEMSGDNVYIRPSSGRRECRACMPIRRQRAMDKPLDERVLNHGTASAYARGCHCDACRTANSTYRRERARKRRAA